MLFKYSASCCRLSGISNVQIAAGWWQWIIVIIVVGIVVNLLLKPFHHSCCSQGDNSVVHHQRCARTVSPERNGQTNRDPVLHRSRPPSAHHHVVQERLRQFSVILDCGVSGVSRHQCRQMRGYGKLLVHGRQRIPCPCSTDSDARCQL